MDLTNTVTIITGASRRLGRELAIHMAGLGSKIVVNYHKAHEEANQVVHLIEEQDGIAWAHACNLCEPNAPQILFEKALKRFGRVDYIINNASLFSTVPLEELTESQIGLDLSLHVQAPMLLTTALYMHLKNSGREGSVINITDTRSSAPSSNRPSYLTAKAALEAETRILAKAVAPHLRINAIAPGTILPSDFDVSYFSRRKDQLPMKRNGSIADILRTVDFLLDSPFITGEVIRVDGGEHLL